MRARPTLSDTRAPLVRVGLGSPRESQALFILLSEYIQVSPLALASSFWRSHKYLSKLLLNNDKMKLEATNQFSGSGSSYCGFSH